MKVIKSEIHARCLDLVEERIASVKDAMVVMQASAANESKSSAGDKYETGRAMAHLEIEKLQTSLNNFLEMKSVLSRMDPERPQTSIVPGALVQTDRGWFYVAVGLGEIKVEGERIMVISSHAPLAETFRKTSAGDVTMLNGQQYQIEKIY